MSGIVNPTLFFSQFIDFNTCVIKQPTVRKLQEICPVQIHTLGNDKLMTLPVRVLGAAWKVDQKCLESFEMWRWSGTEMF
jgi:hypothetical protein